MIRFDETPVPSADLSALDEALWRRFAPGVSTDRPETLLSKLAMAAKDENEVWRPTVAGLLMGSPHPERYLPCAFIQAIAYSGNSVVPENEGVYQRDAKDIGGALDRQILAACRFVRENMKVAAVKLAQGGRRDLPQFDMLAIFEAVTNAVAHRDYSMPGSKIRLRLFDDRLELYTPGSLPNTMSTESLRFRQAARNEVITSLLARCPIEVAEGLQELGQVRSRIMDKRGEGVPIILERSRALSGVEPEYRMIDDSELRLTIYAARIGDAEAST